MHFIRQPISIVLSTIGPRVLTFAVNVVVCELPRVTGPVLPLELSVTDFCAIHVLTFVASAVEPRFHAPSVLLVIQPVPLVHRPIVVLVATVAIRLIVSPLTRVNVAICMDQSAHAVRLAADPLALIEGAIDPDLTSYALARFWITLQDWFELCRGEQPLAVVDNAGEKPEWRPVDQWGLMVAFAELVAV